MGIQIKDFTRFFKLNKEVQHFMGKMLLNRCGFYILFMIFLSLIKGSVTDKHSSLIHIAKSHWIELLPFSGGADVNHNHNNNNGSAFNQLTQSERDCVISKFHSDVDVLVWSLLVLFLLIICYQILTYCTPYAVKKDTLICILINLYFNIFNFHFPLFRMPSRAARMK